MSPNCFSSWTLAWLILRYIWRHKVFFLECFGKNYPLHFGSTMFSFFKTCKLKPMKKMKRLCWIADDCWIIFFKFLLKSYFKSQKIRIGKVFYEIIQLGGICNSHIEYLLSFVFVLLFQLTWFQMFIILFLQNWNLAYQVPLHTLLCCLRTHNVSKNNLHLYQSSNSLSPPPSLFLCI